MLLWLFVFAALRPLGPARGGLRLQYDPRRLRVGFRADSGTVSAMTAFGDVTFGERTRIPLAEFNRELTRRSFERQWREAAESRRDLLAWVP